MQTVCATEFGVSPAFFVSLHGESFGPSHVETSLPLISELGYTAYQGEIFRPEVLGEWTESSTRAVRERAAECGLRSDTFVAHFAGHSLAVATDDTANRCTTDDFRRACAVAADLTAPNSGTVVVPSLPVGPAAASFSDAWPTLVDETEQLAGVAGEFGLRFAIETVPGGMVSSSAWFERLRQDLGSDLWFLLDTGNIWAAGEVVSHAAERLCGRMAATHLCDARDLATRSAEPGTGEVPLSSVLRVLTAGSYRGGLDVEIACPANDVADMYGQAIEYMRRETSVSREGVHHE